MGKYLTLAKITFEEYLVYRLNFVLWRFRSLVSFLTLFFFWLAIYDNKNEFLGYRKSQMLAYVVGIAVLRSVVLSSRSVDLGGQIRSGELTKIVLRPLRAFSFWFPTRLGIYIIFALMIILATFLYFFLSFVHNRFLD